MKKPYQAKMAKALVAKAKYDEAVAALVADIAPMLDGASVDDLLELAADVHKVSSRAARRFYELAERTSEKKNKDISRKG